MGEGHTIFYFLMSKEKIVNPKFVNLYLYPTGELNFILQFGITYNLLFM